jgi:predicted aspartyl protease
VKFLFDPRQGLILVQAEVSGPAGSALLRLALDTGATRTVVNNGVLVAIGYDLAIAHNRVEVTTGSGIEYAALLEVTKIFALGQERLNFPILAHTLPPSTGVDGLLGLDFLRRCSISIDFTSGLLEVG